MIRRRLPVTGLRWRSWRWRDQLRADGGAVHRHPVDSVAYIGAFAWGASGTVFYTVAATTLQRLAPAGTLGQVAGVISTAESTIENLSMPLAGVLLAATGSGRARSSSRRRPSRPVRGVC